MFVAPAENKDLALKINQSITSAPFNEKDLDFRREKHTRYLELEKYMKTHFQCYTFLLYYMTVIRTISIMGGLVYFIGWVNYTDVKGHYDNKPLFEICMLVYMIFQGISAGCYCVGILAKTNSAFSLHRVFIKLLMGLFVVYVLEILFGMIFNFVFVLFGFIDTVINIYVYRTSQLLYHVIRERESIRDEIKGNDLNTTQSQTNNSMEVTQTA